MQQAQSYYSVLFRGRWSIYEARIVVKIVQRARELMKSQGRYADFVQKAYRLDGVNVVMAFAVKELAGSTTHNYEPIKEAVRNLKKWQVEYYDKEAKTWHIASMLDNATLNEHEGILTITCAQWLLEFITDFRNGGYRSYCFEKAMSMRNPFSARMYMLTASMTKPITYQIESIRQVLGVEGSHKRLHDFLRRVIDPAMKELEAKKANGFCYEIIRKYKDRPKSEATAIKIIPIKREGKDMAADNRIEDLLASVPSSLAQFLNVSCKFSYREMTSNKETLEAFAKVDGWQNKLVDIVDRARRKGKNHGYIIAAMKGHVKEQI